MANITYGGFPPGRITATAIMPHQSNLGITTRGSPIDVVDLTLHTGVRSGFVKTINADPTKIDIAAGTGIIVDDTDPLLPIIIPINLPAQIGITDPFLTSPLSHLYIDKFGARIFKVTTPTRDDVKNLLYLGGIVHDSGIISFPVPDPIVAQGTSRTEMETLVFGGGVTLEGGELSPTEPDLTLKISAAIVNQYGRNFQNDPGSPNITDFAAQDPIPQGSFFKVLTSIVSGFVFDTSTNLLNPLQFNENSAGILVNVANQKYTTIRAFASAADNNVLFYYGTEEFASLTDAMTIPEQTFTEDPITKNISPIAKIFIRQDVTNLTTAISGGTTAAIQFIKNRTQL